MSKEQKLSKPSMVAKQLSGMMVITIITQLISVYKSSITAANFGACVELDAYNFANNLTSFFLTFVSSGITTVVIPAYVKKLDRKAIDTFLSVVFSVTAVLIFATFVFRGQLVDLMTSREPAFKTYVCSTMLLTIGIQAFPAILGVTTAYFQCVGKFNIPKIVLLVSNIGTVVILMLLKDFTLYQYLYVLLAGAVFQFVVDLIFAIKYGFRFSVTFEISNSQFKQLMAIFLPTLFSTGVYKVNTFIDTLLSSNIGTGQLTILSYSNVIVGMVNTLIIGNLITYVYPQIVKALSQGTQESQGTFWKYANAFHVVVCVIVVGFVCVGREFIGMLYEHGEFTKQAADAVYLCMCIYIFAQQNNIVRDMVYRYFFAAGDTKTTVKNGLMTSCVNIGTSIILVQVLGVYGIILGTFIAGIVSLVGILIRFKRKFGFVVDMKPVIRIFLGTEVAVLTTILAISLLKRMIPVGMYVISFFLYGCVTVMIYLVLLVVFNRELLKKVLRSFRNS